MNVANREIFFDPEAPLKRAKDESLRANQALRDYALMGPGRSIRKLCEQYRNRNPGNQKTAIPTSRVGTLLLWSSTYRWQDRIAQWELLQAQEAERHWAERRKQLREEEWDLGSKLLELAKNMLAESPKFLKTSRRVTRDGREIITVALDSKFMVQLAEMSAKLRRLAAGMETDHQRHSGALGLVEISAEDLAQARNAAKKLEDELLSKESDDE